MNFFDHLDELRARLMRALWVFMGGFLLCYLTVTEQVMAFLRAPLFKILPPEQQKLYFTSLFENFLTHLKISAVCSIFLLSPYFFYELWGFISPGLYAREKKWVFPFIFATTFFFFSGAAFAYFVLFPTAFHFFVTYGAQSDAPMLTIQSYYSTCLKLLLLFGAAFELPVLITFLGIVGILDAATLKAHRRNAIIGITIASALFAPPDAISMLILMVPLILLFELSIHVVSWIQKKQTQNLAKT